MSASKTHRLTADLNLPTTEAEWDALDETELDVLERKIAGKYMSVFPWEAVAWALGNVTIWLSLWPLVFLDIMPLWLAAPIATLNVMLAYLPSHEAQHRIIARRGQPLWWLNEFVGHVSLIPFAQPYRILRDTHMEHHAHANHPELDPDFAIASGGKDRLDFFKHTIMRRQPGAADLEVYAKTVDRVGKGHVVIDAIIYNLVYFAVLFGLAWSGYAIEAALLWWVPRHVTLTYVNYYLSWAPHRPAEQQGRYKDTQPFRSQLGNLVSMGMQYHAVHHLYPRIPLTLTPAAFRDMRPILIRKGMDTRGL